MQLAEYDAVGYWYFTSSGDPTAEAYWSLSEAAFMVSKRVSLGALLLPSLLGSRCERFESCSTFSHVLGLPAFEQGSVQSLTTLAASMPDASV